MKKALLLVAAAVTGVVHGQYTPPDLGALEQIVVERYYHANLDDAQDSDGGPGLMENATTYRLYADLKPGYEVQTVYGSATHPLTIQTSDVFWNNTDRGERTGDAISDNRLDENTVAIDSWITVGAASDAHWGSLKALDSDGSIVGGSNNDGGSNSVAGGLLANANGCMTDSALTIVDGLITDTMMLPVVTTIGLNLDIFDDQNGPVFTTSNGAWSVLGGTSGPTIENHVLLGQFTTVGTFEWEINVVVGIPAALQCNDPDCHTFIEYVATLIPGDTLGGGPAADNITSIPSLMGAEGFCTSVDVTENPANSVLSVYPNPARDVININLTGTELNNGMLQLFDLLGRERSIEIERVSESTAVIDVSSLASGVYSIVLHERNGMRHTEQFIIR